MYRVIVYLYEYKTASELDAVSWFPNVLPENPDEEINPSEPNRNDTTQDWFQTYSLGIGGPCKNFYPMGIMFYVHLYLV